MTEGMTNEQFRILREDFAQMRVEFNQRFDNLVTRETFTDERRRVDGRFLDSDRRSEERHKESAKQISELEAALNLESQTRQQERADALKAQVSLNNEREKERRGRMWQWLVLAVSLVGGPIAGALIASAMQVGGP